MPSTDRRDLFEAAVKVMGLWLFVTGVLALAPAAYYAWQAGFAAYAVGDYLVSATPRILLGLLLVATSGWITRVCYRSG